MSGFPMLTVNDLVNAGEAAIQTGPFGTQLAASEYVRDGIPVINVRNIGFGRIREADLEFLNESKAYELRKHQLKVGDIVFGRKGAVERHVLIDQHADGWIQGSDCLRLRLSGKRVHPPFLSYFFTTKAHQDWMQALCSFGATMSSLNQDIVKRISFPCPPLETQRKIAGILSAYDDLIENNRRRIAILERMAEELYREWFVRMRFPGYQNTKFVKGVPEGWEATYASNLFQIMGGGTPQTENSNYWDGEIPFFTPKDAPDNYVVFDTEKTITPDGLDSCSSRLFPEGTIFMTARGTVGKIAIAGCDMAMNQSCYALRPKMQGSDALMFHFLTLRLAVAYFKGMSNSGVFDNIVTDTFKIIPMMWPGEQLIKQFHGFAHPLVSKAASLIQLNKHLAQSRNSLLGRLISGKATTDGLQVLLPPSQSVGDHPMTNSTELAHA